MLEGLQLPVRRISGRRGHDLDPRSWPASVPAVAQVLRDGLEFAPVTVLVGENGSGKSTLVEALALAVGMSPEGGSKGARHSTRATESPLHDALMVEKGVGRFRGGFFLRAETMHGFYSYLEANPPPLDRPDPNFHEMSHGESFLAVLQSRFVRPGLYLLDEPESALSFQNCLGLVSVLSELARSGSQVVVATHSPVVAATPGATILQLDDEGIAPVAWEDLDLVTHHRHFLAAPERYLRHLT